MVRYDRSVRTARGALIQFLYGEDGMVRRRELRHDRRRSVGRYSGHRPWGGWVEYHHQCITEDALKAPDAVHLKPA